MGDSEAKAGSGNIAQNACLRASADGNRISVKNQAKTNTRENILAASSLQTPSRAAAHAEVDGQTAASGIVTENGVPVDDAGVEEAAMLDDHLLKHRLAGPIRSNHLSNESISSSATSHTRLAVVANLALFMPETRSMPIDRLTIEGGARVCSAGNVMRCCEGHSRRPNRNAAIAHW